MADVARNLHVEAATFEPRPVAERSIARERRLATLAVRQHRAVGHDQMLHLGFERGSINHRLKTHRIWRVHPNVYAIGPGPLDQRGRWYAALLVCRPLPALSHLSAAAEAGLALELGSVHVTVPRRYAKKLRGVSVHGARHLHPLDLTRRGGLPVTALHRTLLDVAETEPFGRLESIWEECDRRGWLDLAAVRACMERNPGRRGLKALGRLLDGYVPVLSANEGIERTFQRLLEEEGFPQPLTNVQVAGLVVDCYWPEYDFVVELDSREFHSHWQAQERDRARDGTLLRAGIACLRVTHRRMTRERGDLVRDLASRLPRVTLLRGGAPAP